MERSQTDAEPSPRRNIGRGVTVLVLAGLLAAAGVIFLLNRRNGSALINTLSGRRVGGGVSDCAQTDLSALLMLDDTTYLLAESVHMTLITTNSSDVACRIRFDGRNPHHGFFVENTKERGRDHGAGNSWSWHHCHPGQADFSAGEEIWRPGHNDVKSVIWDQRKGIFVTDGCINQKVDPGTYEVEARFLARGIDLSSGHVAFEIEEPTPSRGPSPTPTT